MNSVECTMQSVDSPAIPDPLPCLLGIPPSTPPQPTVTETVTETLHSPAIPDPLPCLLGILSQPPTPAWAEIAALFQSPYWISLEIREATGTAWIDYMKSEGFDVTLYATVSTNAVTIYDVMESEQMTPGGPAQYFPAAALLTFSTWMMNGCPE